MDTDAAGPPPTPDQRARRDRRTIVTVCVAAFVLAVPTLFGAASVVRAFGDAQLGSEGTAAEGDAGPDTSRPPAGDVEVPTLDLEELSGTDAEFGRLLTDVDRSEQAMLSAQVAMGEAFGAADPQADPDEALTAASAAAGDGQRELQELRSDLARPVDDDTAGEVRDAYLSHLDAWVRYLVAIEDDPELLLRPDAESSLTLAIDTTGDEFAQLLDGELPDDLDPQVVELAEAIVERGFADSEPDSGDLI